VKWRWWSIWGSRRYTGALRGNVVKAVIGFHDELGVI